MTSTVDGATVETTDGAAVLVLVPDIAEIRRQHNKLIVEIVQIRYMLIYQHLSIKKTLSLKKKSFLSCTNAYSIHKCKGTFL